MDDNTEEISSPTIRPSAPAKIDSGDIRSAIEKLGFHPDDVRNIMIHSDWGVSATIYKTGEDGKRVFINKKEVKQHILMEPDGPVSSYVFDTEYEEESNDKFDGDNSEIEDTEYKFTYFVSFVYSNRSGYNVFDDGYISTDSPMDSSEIVNSAKELVEDTFESDNVAIINWKLLEQELTNRK